MWYYYPMITFIDSGANNIDMRSAIMRHDSIRIFTYSILVTIIIATWYSCIIVQANNASGTSSSRYSSSITKQQQQQQSSSSVNNNNNNDQRGDQVRKFPILRALVSQFVSDRSSRDLMINKDDSEILIGSFESIQSSSYSTPSFQSQRIKDNGKSTVVTNQLSTNNINKQQQQQQQQQQSSKSNLQQQQQQQASSNAKSIQHIIDDINSQNSKISNKRRKRFLVNILSRMLKSVNFTEVRFFNQLSKLKVRLQGVFVGGPYSDHIMTLSSSYWNHVFIFQQKKNKNQKIRNS